MIIRLFACNVHCNGLGTQLPCCMTQLRTDSSQNALLLEPVSATFFAHTCTFQQDTSMTVGEIEAHCVCLHRLTRTVGHFAVSACRVGLAGMQGLLGVCKCLLSSSLWPLHSSLHHIYFVFCLRVTAASTRSRAFADCLWASCGILGRWSHKGWGEQAQVLQVFNISSCRPPKPPAGHLEHQDQPKICARHARSMFIVGFCCIIAS